VCKYILFCEKFTIVKRSLLLIMNVYTFENGPFMVNTYLITNNKSGIVIDPGSSDMDYVTKKAGDENIEIEAIVLTHGHIDHVSGVPWMKNALNVPVYANSLDKEVIDTVSIQARMFGVADPGSIPIDNELPASGTIEMAGIPFTLLHTPGHSKGSVSLYTEGLVIVGDALFNMSIGRTDLPGGSYEELITSIREKLFTLPEETRVLCGHGPETSIGFEKKMNPFFR
jgi:hydroxyacylglutathione hydrolase